MVKLLLHVCCAPCGSYCIEVLKSLGYDVVLFYPNSNIYPKKEWKKRLEDVKKLSKIYDVELFVKDYNHNDWLKEVSKIKNFSKEKEGGKRCDRCFYFNLKKTAEKALELGIDLFTTTLTISPYKNSEKIFSIGKRISIEGVNFLEINFKKKNGFKKSIELSKKYGFYRQRYCGCEFSFRDYLTRSMASPRE